MGLVLPALASDREDDIGRVEKATRVFREIMATPDKGIPRDLLEKANALPSFQERRSSPSYLEATTAMGWRPAALTRPTCVWSPTGCTKSAGGQPEKSSSRPEHPWHRRKRNEPAIGAIFCLCAVALDGCHRTFFAEHFEIWFESTGEVHQSAHRTGADGRTIIVANIGRTTVVSPMTATTPPRLTRTRHRGRISGGDCATSKAGKSRSRSRTRRSLRLCESLFPPNDACITG